MDEEIKNVYGLGCLVGTFVCLLPLIMILIGSSYFIYQLALSKRGEFPIMESLSPDGNHSLTFVQKGKGGVIFKSSRQIEIISSDGTSIQRQIEIDIEEDNTVNESNITVEWTDDENATIIFKGHSVTCSVVLFTAPNNFTIPNHSSPYCKSFDL